jgi:hypothetical protein
MMDGAARGQGGLEYDEAKPNTDPTNSHLGMDRSASGPHPPRAGGAAIWTPLIRVSSVFLHTEHNGGRLHYGTARGQAPSGGCWSSRWWPRPARPSATAPGSWSSWARWSRARSAPRCGRAPPGLGRRTLALYDTGPASLGGRAPALSAVASESGSTLRLL